jgi:uncharacterized protein (TIGR03545 family)
MVREISNASAEVWNSIMILRLKVFIPVLLVVILSLVISALFIDTWVKRWIENGISSITETKTDISDLKLSFSHSSLRIRRLQIASQKEEYKNAVEFENIVVDFQTLPLLKKRFVIDEFSIEGIQWGTPRKTSGKLPPRIKSSEPSYFSELKNSAFAALRKEFDEMPVSKLSDFKIPTDPREIVNSLNLKSTEAYKIVIGHAEELRAKWPEKFRDLKNTAEIEKQMGEARRLVENPPQNPQEILQRITEVKKTMEFLEAEKKRASDLFSEIKTDTNKIQTDYEVASKALQEDFNRAKQVISLDELNIGNISRLLFGAEWLAHAEQILRYHQILRNVLAKTDNEEVQVRQRDHGRDIVFIVPKKQPSFVLAKSDFSVKTLENGEKNLVTQVYQLKLRDINSSPKLYGKPTSVDFKGEFKNAKVGEVDLDLFWDYTKELATDKYKVAAKRIAAEMWPMGIPVYLPLRLEKGLADASSEISFTGDDMRWTSRVQFSEVIWNFADAPKQSLVFDLLREIFLHIKNFHLDLELASTGGKFEFNVKSDLDSIVQSALTQVIEKRLNEFKARLKLEIENRQEGLQKEARKSMDLYKSEVENRAQGYLNQITGYENEVNKLEEQLKKKAQGGLQEKLKKLF